MKKSLTLFAFVLGMSGAFAQDLTSKKGEPMLPEQGDWGLGIDATPFLDYAGNFFGKSSNNTAPTFNFLTPYYTITGRYFTDATTCYRGSVRLGLGSITERSMVSDQLAQAALNPTANGYPNADPMVENSWKHSNTNIGLTGGIEMRKGKSRLQGYYGGEVGIFFGTSKDKFTYGNTLAATNAASTTVVVTAADQFSYNANGDIANNVSSTVPISGMVGSARVTERKNGTSIAFGLRGFIGVEYFMFPKISLGGEFGWGFGFVSNGKTNTTWESLGDNGNPANTTLTKGDTEIEAKNGGGFKLDTDNMNSIWGPIGTLRLNFYF